MITLVSGFNQSIHTSCLALVSGTPAQMQCHCPVHLLHSTHDLPLE